MVPNTGAAFQTLAAAAPGFPLTSPRSGRPRDHRQLGHAPSPAARADTRLRKLPPPPLLPTPPAPTAQAREYAPRTRNLGSLRISLTSGRSPPTRPRDWGGGSSCGRVGAGLPGTLPPPRTLCPGSRAGRKPAGQPGAEERRGSLRATAHECEPYTCSLEHLAEKHVSQPALGLTISRACFQDQLVFFVIHTLKPF